MLQKEDQDIFIHVGREGGRAVDSMGKTIRFIKIQTFNQTTL